jgi:thiol-disulfide isomerase/thioredoxin
VSLFGARRHPRTAALAVEGHLPGFDGATGWLNSSPLTPAELRGRVVLVDFWTYTCINWLRTLAFVRAWAAKYGDLGLVVIGVHTPEFPFEREVDNVRGAARAMRVEYPLAIDSDYGVWSAFANRYWPAVYLADAEGRIRYHPLRRGRVRRRPSRRTSSPSASDGLGPSTVPVHEWGETTDQLPSEHGHAQQPQRPDLGVKGSRFQISPADQTDGRHPT